MGEKHHSLAPPLVQNIEPSWLHTILRIIVRVGDSTPQILGFVVVCTYLGLEHLFEDFLCTPHTYKMAVMRLQDLDNGTF